MTIADAGKILKQAYPELRKDSDESVARKFFAEHKDNLAYLNKPADAFKQLISALPPR